MEVFGKGRISRRELFELARLTKEALWTGIEFIKGNKKIGMITTDDLDADKGYKLFPNYLERRRVRDAKRNKKKGKSFGWPK